jgi:hypothetical protein
MPYFETPSCEIYDPMTHSFKSAASLNVPRSYHAAICLPDGNVLVTGGLLNDGSLASCELYVYKLDKWITNIPPLTARRSAHSIFLLHDCYIIIVGGELIWTCSNARYTKTPKYCEYLDLRLVNYSEETPWNAKWKPIDFLPENTNLISFAII